MRRRLWFLVPPLLLILALTLVPDPGAGDELPLLCLVCGRRALADALLNVALFVPLGAALGAAGLGAVATLLAGTALTAGIESAQIWIPGRVPSSADLLTNVLGALAGWLLFRTGAALLATPRRRAGLAWAAAALAPATIALTGVLLAPAWPATPWIAEWTPEPASHPGYDGSLDAVHIGAVAVPDAPLGAGSAALAAALRAGAPLALHGTAGSSPPRAVPLFRIVDEPGREVLLVAAHGDAVYVRFRTRSAALLLDNPELRLDGALRGVRAGEPLRVEVRPAGRHFCIRVNQTASCELRYTAADGWRLLLDPPGLPTRVRTVLGMFWLCALALPAGLLAPRHAGAALGRALLVAAGIAAALLLSDRLVPAALDAATLVVGFVAGYAIRGVGRRLRAGGAGVDAAPAAARAAPLDSG